MSHHESHVYICSSTVLPFESFVHPTYQLTLIKGLMKEGAWTARESAQDGALELGFDPEEDIYDCVVNHLNESHFHKTMPSVKRANLMQDVYHITYQAVRLYVKLQVDGDAVVVSFKKLD